MNPLHNPKLDGQAKHLRRNMTKEERHLWYDFLKGLPIMVHRQKVIGQYIVDFYVAQGKIVIEVDGSQHYEAEGMRADTTRDANLKAMGMQILRYSNAEINYKFDAVCQDIWNHLYDAEVQKPSP